MMISKRTNTELVDDMIRKNIQATVETCEEQRNQRKNFKLSSPIRRRKMDYEVCQAAGVPS